MTKRVEQLRKVLAAEGLDALITENPVNRRYISGFSGSTGWAIVSADAAVLVTDFRYVEQAAGEAVGYTVVNNERKPLEAIAKVLSSHGIKRLGIEKNLISLATYEDWREAFAGVELVPTSGLIERLRMYKDEDELTFIREAMRMADDAFNHVLNFIKPGVRESDVALELEFFMRRQGADGKAFDIIVASGERGALPHGRASDKLIQAGEMVTMDFGAAYQGYHSDLTRTVSVGEPHPQMREIYEIVLKAQLACVQGLKPGMTGKEGDAIARDIIAAAGYGEAFGHSTGHGLGMLVHEQPNLSAASHIVLEPGMLVTVEPGIYISGLGGVRIEDDVLMTADGCEILTKSTKELLILPV